MKIRSGFVSNSSSSSFLIYGKEIDISELAKKVGLTEENYYELFEMLDDKKYLDKINLISGCGSEYFYLGRSWDSIDDNETGREFKKSIKDEISKLLGEDIECDTIKGAWFD